MKNWIRSCLILCSFSLTVSTTNNYQNVTSFSIDYDNDRFLLDGEPFRYLSGSIHYFRVHHRYWEDRLRRMRALGLNAIQTYVPWNFHEPVEGQYIFDHQRDLVEFLRIAERLGLYVLLRPGPYICAEWENGGLPWWLLKREGIRMRVNDPLYTTAVEKWMSVLLPKIEPLLRKNGGPILMVQVENEYGSYGGCDGNYTIWLRDLYKKFLGEDTLLYTTDGGDEYFLKCGPIPGVYPTIDFGPTSSEDVDKAFKAQRNHTPNHRGPLVNSEYYVGWFDMWNATRDDSTPDQIVDTAKYMYELGASINFYLIHGGTNFGFWNGAENDGAVLTSYNFSAPVEEDGSINSKYLALRTWIKSLKDWKQKPQDVPRNPKKIGYGKIKMEHVGGLLDLPSNQCVESEKPKTFEQMDHSMGFMAYSTILKTCGRNLTFPEYKDWLYVFLDGEHQGTLYRHPTPHQTTVQLKNCRVGQEVTILAENEGRLTYETINDYKGILADVSLDSTKLSDWNTCTIQIGKGEKFQEKTLQKLKKLKAKGQNNKVLHGVFTGTFNIEKGNLADTFIDFSNWGKGLILVNGHNIGRYWKIGPQFALYVPKHFLKEGGNRIFVIELFHKYFDCNAKHKCKIESIDHGIWRYNSTMKIRFTYKRP
ncbi:unnamed protein product, partial [Mesorhabditis belari]|uniref:Beta-galactosidase n=1 Tax=Mesorhabditis belari TaxID=2138241 RepID=A0AAF3EIQ3_9BILA